MERIALRAGIACAAAVALLACGETREEKFEKAMRVAESARSAVESAEKEVEEREATYSKEQEEANEAQQKLEEARDKLAAATDSLQGARAEVAKWADDATLFRNVQQRLLEDDALEGAAVAVRIDHGIAVLEGTVPDEEARERAVAIARETPGIVDVQSQLVLASQQTPAAPLAPPAPAAESPPVLEPAPPVEPAPQAMPEAMPEALPDATHEIAPGTDAETQPAP